MDACIDSVVKGDVREETIMRKTYLLENLWEGEGQVNCPSCKTNGHEKDENGNTLIATDYIHRELMSKCYSCSNIWKRLPDNFFVGLYHEIKDVYQGIAECFKKKH